VRDNRIHKRACNKHLENSEPNKNLHRHYSAYTGADSRILRRSIQCCPLSS
jgi:hypothetical protein